MTFDLRESWWRFLDRWEEQRRLRWTIYSLLALVLTVAVLRFWAYPWWNRRNAINVARQWMLAGKPAYAAEAVQEAINAAPENPEVWRLAGDLARLSGRKSLEVDFARRAAELGPGVPELVLEWASAALRADQPDEADRALAKLSKDELAGSAFALRLQGELERRRGQFTAAMNHFEAALHLDGPVAVDEVPLGIILLGSTDSSLRQRGLQLLGKWAPDRVWGGNALRALLGDAIRIDDRAAMLKWAGALQAHPDCQPADLPASLLAYARADEARFTEVVTQLEKERAAKPEAAALLLAALNESGRSQEAVRWMNTLPARDLHHAPLAVVAAEALRRTGDWEHLRELVRLTEWTPDVHFLGWIYGIEAARALGDANAADELWHSLLNHAQLNAVHALFAGSTIFSWGREKEAEALWWKAA